MQLFFYSLFEHFFDFHLLGCWSSILFILQDFALFNLQTRCSITLNIRIFAFSYVTDLFYWCTLWNCHLSHHLPLLALWDDLVGFLRYTWEISGVVFFHFQLFFDLRPLCYFWLLVNLVSDNFTANAMKSGLARRVWCLNGQHQRIVPLQPWCSILGLSASSGIFGSLSCRCGNIT